MSVSRLRLVIRKEILVINNGRHVWTIGLLAAISTNAYAQWTIINLHPEGTTASKALAVSGGEQVGWAETDRVDLAALWTHSPGSSGAYEHSEARGIWTAGDVIFIAGSGCNAQTKLDVALRWFGTSACCPDCEQDRDLDIFDYLCFQDRYVTGCP